MRSTDTRFLQLACFTLLVVSASEPQPAATPQPASAATRPFTFSHDIAPIVFRNCAPCHRPGQPAPFPLLTYGDVRKRATEIVDVTQRGYMPPWLPAHGFGEFKDERRLSDAQKTALRDWLASGCPEGDPKLTPPQPQWPDGWSLGKPDLVVTMERPYTLAADGPDVYRNFILPVQTDRDHFVAAVEFAPGNSKIVHHAFIKLDAKRASRRLETNRSEPGFSTMNMPAEMPDGQFLTWQPGKMATPGPEGMPWLLPKNSDLVLQAHLNRTGKPEILRSSVGLYFTDRPPTNSCFKLALFSLALDFPAGASNCIVRDSLKLPVPVDVLSVLPHAHYLARELLGYAILPDGSRQWLVQIPHWDFRWQGDYRYAHPLHFPVGTTLHLEYTYDNSTNNVRNPNQPPQRVVYGPQSTDEMCELWLQLVPANAADRAALDRAAQEHNRQAFVDADEHRVVVNPTDAKAHSELGRLLWEQGKHDEGWEHIQRALQLQPDLAEAHLNAGVFLRLANRFPEAEKQLLLARRLDPANPRVYGHLGFVYASLGNAAEAERAFRKALDLDPDDAQIRDALAELQAWQRTHR